MGKKRKNTINYDLEKSLYNISNNNDILEDNITDYKQNLSNESNNDNSNNDNSNNENLLNEKESNGNSNNEKELNKENLENFFDDVFDDITGIGVSTTGIQHDIHEFREENFKDDSKDFDLDAASSVINNVTDELGKMKKDIENIENVIQNFKNDYLK